MILVGEKEISWTDGMTVADLFIIIEDSYSYAAIRLNDRVVSSPNFETTLVPDGSQVYLLPLIAGG
jgi:thiamine biosynthesis protein ThiS